MNHSLSPCCQRIDTYQEDFSVKMDIRSLRFDRVDGEKKVHIEVTMDKLGEIPIRCINRAIGLIFEQHYQGDVSDHADDSSDDDAYGLNPLLPPPLIPLWHDRNPLRVPSRRARRWTPRTGNGSNHSDPSDFHPSRSSSVCCWFWC